MENSNNKQIDPSLYDVYYQLGNIHYEKKEWSQAERYYLQALAIKPDFVAAHNNVAIVLQERSELVRAVHHYRCALAIEPDAPAMYNNMGLALAELGELDASLDVFAMALRLTPDYYDARWNRALTLLQYGDIKNGFAEYECRRVKEKDEEYFLWLKRKPEWQGENFSKKTLVVYYEQGYGDVIHFARYLTMAKERGGIVIFITQKPLVRLFETMLGVDGVIIRTTNKMAMESFDYVIPLLSLPNLFGTILGNVPAKIPYIYADSVLNEICQGIFTPQTLNIGLVWAGNSSHTDDHKRSLALSSFAMLGDLQGVTFYSLQKGEGVEQLANTPEGLTIVDLSEYITDFADTAAYIAKLDIVITVDTAVAHLAGAMGKETWTLLAFSADWRWLRDREDSPWYPSMRLFRQPQPNDWQSVILRVKSELVKLSKIKVAVNLSF